ncbi:MAG: hypothetical protein COV67_07235 [Nitrospinae bacterium CG11_big_fil_rev_8_21_14_0_20_56_8]|nr:MAG: hypothetical protein COV67_07235 [Nitrospinae bacterium CG11_big_fil_rev_8_21_14_0_20_56_8]
MDPIRFRKAIPHKKHELDIHNVEDWPVEKINWVPPDLKEKLGPPLTNQFLKFKKNLEKGEPLEN